MPIITFGMLCSQQQEEYLHSKLCILDFCLGNKEYSAGQSFALEAWT